MRGQIQKAVEGGERGVIRKVRPWQGLLLLPVLLRFEESHFHDCPQSNQALLDLYYSRFWSIRQAGALVSAGDPQERTGAVNVTDFAILLANPK